MVRRCRETTHFAYSRYGGRGITVCDRWASFDNFFADMGAKPEGRSLDRINNNGNYEPTNCRWATKYEQDNNRRSNRLFTVNGVTRTIAEWSRHTGIKAGRLYDRVLTNGWSMERAITEPVDKARGIRHSRAKLTENTVIAIRNDRAAGLSLPRLSAKYGVSVTAAWNVCRRHSWAHVP